MEQCIEAIRSDLADVLVEVRDILAPPRKTAGAEAGA
jgi:hypothetical protein